MSTKCITTKPLDFDGSDPATFKVCTFLVNVLSHMYDQWVLAGSPIPPTPFSWQPANACPVTTDFKVADYDFGPLIWSTFNYGKKRGVTEPFASVVRSKAGGSLYLVYRGSKSSDDFLADDETTMVPYYAPTPDPPSDVKVEKGWYAVHYGLICELRNQLRQIGGAGQKLIITGHSLGSALATLAVPEAVANNMQVRHYNSASPMVGPESFRAYYESLREIGSSPGLLKETFRLVNTADSVPKFPQKPAGYVHVGTEISFNASYSDEFGIPDEKKIHDPCCSYAYAIYNPAKPCNPAYDSCATK